MPPSVVVSFAVQEWEELEKKSEVAPGQVDESRVPVLLQMAAHQVQQDASLTEV